MKQAFAMPIQVGMPTQSTPEHLEQHARLVNNIQVMINQLSAAIKL